jgi:NDP-sugar pyrophosphorylase family protein
MARCGVGRAVLCVNHLAHLIQATVGDGAELGLEVEYSAEDRPLSTVAPIARVADLPDDFIVANGDILTDIDFARLMELHEQQGTLVTVATHERVSDVDYGVIETDSAGLVTAFLEKPSYEVTVSMGVYAFNRRVLDLVPPDSPFGFDDLMNALLEDDRRIATYPFEGYWRDIGRLEDYHGAQRDILERNELLD